MATQNHIRNPLEWGWEHLKQTGQAVGSAAQTMEGTWEDRASTTPTVRRITSTDIREALSAGWRDFGAVRTDIVFLCLLYPLAGLVNPQSHGLAAVETIRDRLAAGADLVVLQAERAETRHERRADLTGADHGDGDTRRRVRGRVLSSGVLRRGHVGLAFRPHHARRHGMRKID